MTEMTLEELDDVKAQEAISKDLIIALREYFSGLEGALERISGIPDKAAVAEILAKRTPKLQGTLNRGVERAMRRGILTMADQFGDDAILSGKPLSVRRTLEAAQFINDTTEAQLERLRKRVKDKPEQWRRHMGDLFRIYSKSRAELIAHHETHLGYEMGRQASAHELFHNGLILQKRWFDVGDDRVDEHCRANSRAGWIERGAMFPGGAKHPPQHHRCRCWVRYKELSIARMMDVLGRPRPEPFIP